MKCCVKKPKLKRGVEIRSPQVFNILLSNFSFIM